MKQALLLSLITLSSFCIKAQEEAQKAFSEGVKLMKLNQFKEAEKQFSIAIKKGITPEGLKMAYIFKGFSLNGLQKYDDAILCFDKSIEIDSLDPASYTDRGIAYSYNKNYHLAILDFEKVLKLDSSGKQAEAAYYYLGRIKSLQYEFENAIRYLDNLLLLVPTDAEGYFLRGTAKSNIMDIKGSIEDYDLAIKYRPDYMEAYANRGFQKINALPVTEKVGLKVKCLPDPCADLKKAKSLGDTMVDDMLFLYCSDCK